MIKNYDPNISWAKQTVEITLTQWEYQITFTTDVGGNCKGFDIFDSAISNIFDRLYEEGSQEVVFSMKNPEGDELEVELYDEKDMHDMVTKIEIVSQEQQEKL